MIDEADQRQQVRHDLADVVLAEALLRLRDAQEVELQQHERHRISVGTTSDSGACLQNFVSSQSRPNQHTTTSPLPIMSANQSEFDATSDAGTFFRRM